MGQILKKSFKFCEKLKKKSNLLSLKKKEFWKLKGQFKKILEFYDEGTSEEKRMFLKSYNYKNGKNFKRNF